MRHQEAQPPPLPKEAYEYMMHELSPLKKEVFPAWEEIICLRVGFWESIWRKKLTRYQTQYDGFARRWVKAREKITVLDKLIDPEDKDGLRKISLLMAGGYLKEMEKHEAELTRIMQDFSNTLREKKTEANFNRTALISMAAVIIAAFSVILSVILSV